MMHNLIRNIRKSRNRGRTGCSEVVQEVGGLLAPGWFPIRVKTWLEKVCNPQMMRDLQTWGESLRDFADTTQGVMVGVSTLEQIGVKTPRFFKKLGVPLAIFQAISGIISVLALLVAKQIHEKSYEGVGSAGRERFVTKHNCVTWDTPELPFDVLAHPESFFKFMVSACKVLDAVKAAKPEESVLSEFLEDISKGHLFTDYVVALQIKGEPCVIWISVSTRKLVMYPTRTGGSNALYELFSELQSDYLNSLRHKLLLVKGALWEGYDFLKIQSQELTLPEFYREDVATQLVTTIQSAVASREKCGFLFYGEPGVGKSNAVFAALHRLEAIVIKIDYSPTESLVNFLRKIKGLPKVILFEEIDIEEDSSVKTERVQAILQFLDSDCYDVAVLTTNSVRLHPALIRSGRCDIKKKLEAPTRPERFSVLKRLNEKYNVLPRFVESQDFASLGKKVCTVATPTGIQVYTESTHPEWVEVLENTKKFTHADLHSVCKLAALHGKSLVDYLPEFKANQATMEEYRENS